LNELTKFNNRQIQGEFDKENAVISEKKFLNMIKFYNKIREIVNCTDLNEINKFIFQNDFTTYNIKVDNPDKTNSNKSNGSTKILSLNNNEENENRNCC
jgi:hypothetical protein